MSGERGAARAVQHKAPWPLTFCALTVITSLITCGVASAASAKPSSGHFPATIRSVSLEHSPQGYRWTLTRAPMPTLRDHQVLVHVRAVALNRDDLELLNPTPHEDAVGVRMGSDAAGDIVALGNAVTGFQVGERVTNTYFRDWTEGTPSRAQIDTQHGARVPGVAAEYIALDDTAVVPLPKGYTYEEGATLPTAGLTAWMATAGRYSLGEGKVVVIEGTGGVSTFAMQFAAATGARIILTSSSDEKLQRTLKIAPHESINYRSLPLWSSRVRELTGGRGADLVVDVGGKSTLPQALHSLAPLGTLSLVGGLTGYDGQIPAGALLNNIANVQAIFVGSRADFLAMIAFIEAHSVHPVIDHIFPLEQYAQALSLLQSDQFVGKLVLRLQEAR